MNDAKKIISGKIFICLVAGILTILLFYGYFVNLMVGEIVAKKHNLRELQEISSEYQQMEEAYFNIIDGFDLTHARSLGFVGQEQNDLIVRSSAVARLDPR